MPIAEIAVKLWLGSLQRSRPSWWKAIEGCSHPTADAGLEIRHRRDPDERRSVLARVDDESLASIFFNKNALPSLATKACAEGDATIFGSPAATE
jgi:hypothetical protein